MNNWSYLRVVLFVSGYCIHLLLPMTFMHVTSANQETTAAYSSWTKIQVHVLPAIKAGLAIP